MARTVLEEYRKKGWLDISVKGYSAEDRARAG